MGTLFSTSMRSNNVEKTRLRRIVMELRSKLADYEKRETLHLEEMHEMNRKFFAMENELNAMKEAWLHPTSISSIFSELNLLQGQLIGKVESKGGECQFIQGEPLSSDKSWPKNLMCYDMEAINRIPTTNPTSSKSITLYEQATKPLMELKKRFTTLDIPKKFTLVVDSS
ncbi:hypothetical protein ACFE04_012786 [Oxalis oulophora]